MTPILPVSYMKYDSEGELANTTHDVGLDQMSMDSDSTVVATEGTATSNPPQHSQANTDEDPLDDAR